MRTRNPSTPKPPRWIQASSVTVATSPLWVDLAPPGQNVKCPVELLRPGICFRWCQVQAVQTVFPFAFGSQRRDFPLASLRIVPSNAFLQDVPRRTGFIFGAFFAASGALAAAGAFVAGTVTVDAEAAVTPDPRASIATTVRARTGCFNMMILRNYWSRLTVSRTRKV